MDNGRSQPSIAPSPEQIRLWYESYDNLFKDRLGRQYFEAYLDGNCGTSERSKKMSERLQFTGAVLGFRTIFEKGNISEAKNFARAIFKRYFGKNDVVKSLLKDDTYARLCEFITSLDKTRDDKDKEFITKLKNAFNDAQREVHESLANSAYRSFLQSDYFVAIYNESQNTGDRNNHPAALNGHSDSITAFSTNFTHSHRLNTTHSSGQFVPGILPSSSSSQARSRVANDEAVFHSHRNFLASNASFAAADAIEANNNRSLNTGAIPKSNKTSNRTRICHPTKPLSSLPEDAEVKINSSNLSQKPSILATSSLDKISSLAFDPTEYNRRQESYFKNRDFPPHPYHVEYGPILPTSAQDSELASYSSGATRSDVSSHIDIRPDSKITEKELKHQHRQIRRDLSSNRGANRGGIDFNKSEHIAAANEERQKGPNPEKDVEAFFELVRSKLEVLAERIKLENMQEMPPSANPINFQSLRALSSQEEGQAILDSHVKKCMGWGEPTPPNIEPMGKVHPSLSSQRPASKTLPRHHPHSQFNNQMSANEKVASWNQEKDSSSRSKKSSHSVHSGSTKSCKSKNCGGERARAAAVGASLSNLMTEQFTSTNHKNHFSGKNIFFILTACTLIQSVRVS